MSEVLHLTEGIIAKAGIQAAPGATLNQIEEAEQRLGVTLPADLCEFYGYCNGLRLHQELFNIVPLEELSIYDHPIMTNLGLAGFTASLYPHAVACREPLSGRVVFTPRDDLMTIHSPDFASFLRQALALLDSFGARALDENYSQLSEDEPLLPISEDIEPAYNADRNDRTPEDDRDGLHLIEAAVDLAGSEEGARDIIVLGFELLSPNQAQVVIPYLRDSDFFLREAAANTLGAMHAEEALSELRFLAAQSRPSRGITQDVTAAKQALQQIEAQRQSL